MARPIKFRNVECFPKSNYFIPCYKKKCSIDEVQLNLEEVEAMRLKDIEKLNQEECAERMNVSRQTFQNIIDKAREKVAIALMEGKAIKIHGGYYTTKECRFKCKICNDIYNINYQQDKEICPRCGSKDVLCNKKESFCSKWCNCNNKNIEIKK